MIGHHAPLDGLGEACLQRDEIAIDGAGLDGVIAPESPGAPLLHCPRRDVRERLVAEERRELGSDTRDEPGASLQMSKRPRLVLLFQELVESRAPRFPLLGLRVLAVRDFAQDLARQLARRRWSEHIGRAKCVPSPMLERDPETVVTAGARPQHQARLHRVVHIGVLNRQRPNERLRQVDFHAIPLVMVSVPGVQ